jgi:hypothetical protein
MKTANYLALVSILVPLCTAAIAEQLPKSGTINVHVGFKISAEPMEVADKRIQGHGTSLGVSFNDRGAGPLHEGPVACFWSFFVSDQGTKSMGYCAYGDSDNDRMFLDFSGGNRGSGDRGVLELVGGTGKYASIQGDGQWSCRNVGPNGQQVCTVQFNYRLP